MVRNLGQVLVYHYGVLQDLTQHLVSHQGFIRKLAQELAQDLVQDLKQHLVRHQGLVQNLISHQDLVQRLAQDLVNQHCLVTKNSVNGIDGYFSPVQSLHFSVGHAIDEAEHTCNECVA